MASGGPGRALQPPCPQACCTGTCVRTGALVPARWVDPGWVPWTSVPGHQRLPRTTYWEERQNPEGASSVLCQPCPLLALGEAGWSFPAVSRGVRGRLRAAQGPAQLYPQGCWLAHAVCTPELSML